MEMVRVGSVAVNGGGVRLSLFDTFGVGRDEVADGFRAAAWTVGEERGLLSRAGCETSYSMELIPPGGSVDRPGAIEALGGLPWLDLSLLPRGPGADPSR